MTARRVVSPRSVWGLVAISCAVALGAAGGLAASGTRHATALGAALGAVAAVLAVLALPSLPTRIPASLILALGGVVVVRHVRQPGVNLALIAIWAVATLLALVLIDRADIDERPRLNSGPPLPRLAGETVRSMVVLAAVVGLVAGSLVPLLGQRPPPRLGSGAPPRYSRSDGAGTSLVQNDSLDTTVRPRLGNEVVMTVTAARPAFWRGETFDLWDGHAWTRSSGDFLPLKHDGETAVLTPPIGTSQDGGRSLTQTFHIEASYADVLFAAAEPVQVVAGRVPAERSDGTLVTFVPFGRGSSYRVTSNVPNATEATLRASDANPVPKPIVDTYGQQPIASARVRALAAQVTANSTTTYDKVRALEAWMGSHTKYSLNAPLARPDVDVVDDFLFNVRAGWCEQIASSLVVMLRSRGIPARLATGFVPGDRSRFTGEWVVRAKHAHAWAEVYFPGVGWQAFDPTAGVPLAGDARAPESLWGWVVHHWPAVLGLLAVCVALFVAGSALNGARVRRRVRRSRSWAARRLDELERLGAGAGRERTPSETVPEYADALAVVLGEARLRTVGSAIDADAFSPDGIAADDRAAADAVLAGMAGKYPPDP